MSTNKAVKKDDVTVGALRILHKDSTKEIEELILNSATNALKAYYKGEKNHFTEVAQQIKKELEASIEGSWHVIVGKSFGSFVTHEVKK
jgi:dynein light chain LC8-type